MGNDKYRYPRLEKPLKEHKGVQLVQIIFINNHADKLITKNIGNDKPRNGDDHIFRQGFYHGKYAAVPALRGLAYLCRYGSYFFVDIAKQSFKISLNGSD